MAKIRYTKRLSDTKISALSGIALSTLNVWKKSAKNSYRYKLYTMLKDFDMAMYDKYFKA